MPSIGRTTLNMKSFFNVFAISAVLLLHKAEAQGVSAPGWYVATAGMSCDDFCGNTFNCDDFQPELIISPIIATYVAAITNPTITAAASPTLTPDATVPGVDSTGVLLYASSDTNVYVCTTTPTGGLRVLCCCLGSADVDVVCPLMAMPTIAPTDTPTVSPTTAAPTTAAPTSAPTTAAPTGGKKAGVPSGGGKRGGVPGGGGKKGGFVPSPTSPILVSTKSGKRRALFSN